MSDKTNTEIVVEAAVKIGLTLFVVNAAKNAIFGEDTGRQTNRVKFDFGNTQVRKLLIPTKPVTWHVVDDPWQPTELADELHNAMKGNSINDGNSAPGWGHDPYPRQIAWEKLTHLGKDRMRWLHNYWLDAIDSKDTLFRWILGEKPLIWSDEYYLKDQIIQLMTADGVGF